MRRSLIAIAAALSLGCVLSFFYLARFAAPPLREAAALSPHLWQDEGYAWNGVRKLRDSGYFGFRCRQDAPMPCYGLTQSVIDLGIIQGARLFRGEEHLRELELKPLKGEPQSAAWFFRVNQPWDAWALRVSRVAFALVLLLSLGAWLTRGLEVSKTERVAWAIVFAGALSFLPTVLWARQGIKNDFPAALALLGALVLYSRHHTVSALLVLGASLGIRFGNAPVLALLIAHQLWLALSTRRTRPYFLAVLGAGLAVVVTHPHLWVSSSEFGSFLSLPGATQTRLDWVKISSEFWTHALPNIAVLLILTVVLTRERRGLMQASRPEFWLVLASLCFVALNLRNGLGRAPYYLPPVVLLLFCIGSAGIRTRKHAVGLIAFIVVPLLGLEVNRPREALAALVAEALPRIEGLKSKHKAEWMALDLKLRESPRASDTVRVLEFDSTRDSPEWLLSRLADERAPGEIVVTCWGGANGPYDERTWSLSLEQWARVVSPLCAQVEQVSRGLIESFENGSRTVKRVQLDLSELRSRLAVAKRAPTWVSRWPEQAGVTRVSPLFFQGAEAGIDLWFAPLALGRDAVLSLDLGALPQAKSVRIQGQTTCKGNAELVLSVSGPGDKQKTDALTLVSGETYCARFPSVCKRLTVRGPFTHKAEIPAGARSLSIKLRGLDLDTCRVFIQPLEFSR